MTTRPALRRTDLFFFGGVIAICSLTIAIGIAPLRLFEHDTFFALDGAFRVVRGQVPHRDFSSAWGPVFFLMDAAGLAMSGLRPAGIGYANALWGTLIAVWVYGIARSRLTAGLACIAGVFTLLLTVAPFALGFNPLSFSHAMAYNRYGFALLGVILLETSNSLTRPGAFSSGIAWAVLGFLKISYAIMALPFLLIAFTWSETRKQRLIWLSIGASAVTLPLAAYLRFDFSDMFHDLVCAASGRSQAWTLNGALNAVSITEALPLILLAGIVCVKAQREACLRSAAIAFATLVASFILLSTNHQAESLPLTGFAALVLSNEWLAWCRKAGVSASSLPRNLEVAILAGFCLLPLVLENTTALVAAKIEERRPSPATSDRLTSERGALMKFELVASPITSETGGPAYVDALNDGLDLLRRDTPPGAGVLAMDMFDPFNYLLDRRPPKGGMVAAAYNYVFSDAAHLPTEQFFGDARYVMVRKYSRDAQDYSIEAYYLSGLKRIYGPALRNRFRLVEETAHWTLWEKR